MRTNYGKSLRRFFANFKPLTLIDLGPGIFDSATVDTNILIVQNAKTKTHNLNALTLKSKSQITAIPSEDWSIMSDLSENSWIILKPEEQAIKDKMEKLGKPLKNWGLNINRGILTGYNPAFIIDGRTKDQLIAQDPKSAEIIKPILRGRDTKRYKAEFADLWIISTFPALHIDIDKYPAVKKYLEQFLPKIKQTGETFTNKAGQKEKTRKLTGNKWFETQDQIGYYKEFEKEKIIYPNMTKYFPFIYDNNKFYTNQKCYIATGSNLKYIVALLNSKTLHYYIRQNLPELQGGTRELSKVFFQNVPIVKYSNTMVFDNLVDQILAKKESGEDTTAEEQQIDLMVYKLYELTYDEVKIVDPETPLNKEEYERFELNKQ